jgi:RND family efflux transporter MFP subunit
MNNSVMSLKNFGLLQLMGFNMTRIGLSKVLVIRLLAVELFSACSALQASPPIKIYTQSLSEVAIYPESAAPAVVVSLNDTPLAAQIDAVAEQVLVKVGDSVKAGVVLVKLVCKDFELERSRLQAEQRTIQARLDLTHWQLKQADTLASQQVLPEEQLQEKRAQLAVLQGELAAQAARLNLTERQISQCLVKAPFSGVVTARLIADGQLLTRGTVMLQLLDANRVELSAQVPSQDIAGLQKAETLRFEHNGKQYPLQLRAVLPTVQTVSGTQEVRLDFKAAQSDSGTSGRLIWRDSMPHVPAAYLLQHEGHMGVFMVVNGKAQFQALRGAQSGRPAIVSLPPETQLVVTGQFNLTDGMPVNVETGKEP